MAASKFDENMAICNERTMTVLESLPNLRNSLDKKVAEPNVQTHRLATDAHWDILLSMIKDIPQSLDAIEELYRTLSLENDAKSVKIRDLEDSLQQRQDLEQQHLNELRDVQNYNVKILSEMGTQNSTIKELRDSLAQSRVLLEQEKASFRKETARMQAKHRRRIEAIDQDYEAEIRSLRAYHREKNNRLLDETIVLKDFLEIRTKD